MLRSSPSQKLHRRSPNKGAPPLFLKTFTLLTLVIVISPLIQTESIKASVPGQANVSIIDNAFLSKHINVTTGTTVIWTYASNWSSLHTVTSVGNTTQDGSPLLNSGTLHPGQSYSYTFYRPGLYTYQCSYHFTTPAMSNAWVNVTEAPVTPPPTQNPPPDYIITVAAITIAAVTVATLALFVRRKKRRVSVAPTSPQTAKP